MSAKSIEEIVRELADKDEIRELTHRYAHAIWQQDPAGCAVLFTDDGVMDAAGQRSEGRGAVEETLRQALSAAMKPMVHNHIIDVQGDTATGICYVDLRGTVQGRSMIGAAYYDDMYERVDGRWKFKSRKLTMTFFAPLKEGWAESAGG